MRQLLPLAFLAPLISSADPLTIHENYVQNPSCSSLTGAIDIWVSGGMPPYTYAWSNFTTDEDALGLAPGYIEVTVTDAMSAQATQGWTLMAVPLSSPSSAQDGHASCIGQIGGEVQVIEWGINGTPPYTYNPPPAGVDPQGDPFFYFPFDPVGTVVYIDVTDNDGCTGTVMETITGPQPVGGPVMVLQGVQGSCSGGSGGTATITNVYDGYFFSGPEVTLFDPQQQGTYQGTAFNNTITFNGLAPGHYYVSRNWDPQGYIMAFPCPADDTLGFDIPDLGLACGTVSGDVFIDNNNDCVQGVGEVGVPYEVLEIQPGPQYAITDASGHYSLDIVDGSYSLYQDNPSIEQHCPASVPVPFVMSGNAQVIDLADSSLVPLDLGCTLSRSPMRPGLAGTYWFNVRNLSAQVSGPITVTLQIDNNLDYVSAFPVPTNVAGNTITWDLPFFTAYQQQNFTVNVQVPVGTPIGTQLVTVLSVSNTLPEPDLSNNTAGNYGVVTNSYDPNVKTARTSSGWSDQMYFVDEDQYIDYTIQFQNTGTAQAIDVVVTDTLSGTLDMGSFEQGVASHPFTVSFRPDRVVEWRFANINLPDSTTNEPLSHGAVTFRIRPTLPLVVGAIISNAANIYFDLNEPVITASADLVASVTVGVQGIGQEQVRVFPNPASRSITITAPNEPMRTVDIIGADGRTVLRQTAADRSVVVDVSDLASGIYLVKTRLADGEELHCRFIKH